MSGEGKKISFSFSKVKKPALANKVNKDPKEKIDYVDCFDGAKGQFSYKGNVKNEEPKKQELIIPLVSGKTSSDIVKSRINEKYGLKSTNESQTKESNCSQSSSNSENGRKSSEKVPKSIEELAASEILNEIKNHNKEKESTLVIETNEAKNGEEESEADIDYDTVPVNDFGMAMLRGMGWKPNSGIGKEPKLVATVSPKLRPKGLGLGAKESVEAIASDNSKKKSK